MNHRAAAWKQPLSRAALSRAAAIALAALILLWPALYNGYPLLYPDVTEYLVHGLPVLQSIVHSNPLHFMYARSEMYSAGIYFFHWNKVLWPVVVMQSVLTAWLLWLVARTAVSRRLIATYLAGIALLSFFTGVGWYVSLPMPDITGSFAYLGIYLLVFRSQSLKRWESLAVAAISCWSMMTHASHLVIAGGLCVFLAFLWLLRWFALRTKSRQILLAGGLVLLAILAQTALHKRIYGQASIFGVSPPYLMARVLGDGPARLYLQQHCATLTWTICHWSAHLPTSAGEFLWEGNGVWQTATPEQQLQLRQQQMALVTATLHEYPRQQAESSWSNFVKQLTTMGPNDFLPVTYFTPAVLQWVMPGMWEHYRDTRQAHNTTPQEFFRVLQIWVVIVCLIVIAALLPRAWRTQQSHLLGLTAMVVFVLLANAFIAGVLSDNAPRYQGRVVWLIALPALLLAESRFRRSIPATEE